MTKLIIRNDDELLIERPELAPMLENFQQQLPEIKRGRENFGKRQSQFMDNILTVNKHTPLRNMRQILSEVEKTYAALQEGYFKQKKTKVEIKIAQRDAELESDELKRELLLIEADRLTAELESGQVYVSGAIRKLENYTEQYKSIQAKIMKEQGVTEFSEIDFEREEERYHIMTAFSQALNAARSKGRIDEGNQIYMQQLGINGMAAEMEIQGLLKLESKYLEQGKQPGNDLVLQFLENMADKYQGCSKQMVDYRGMTVFTESAAVTPKLLEEK